MTPREPRDLEDALRAEKAARVAAERRLRKAAAERDVLLLQAHRRVKNNLQVIASLLEMQRRRLRQGTGPGAVDALIDARNRVQAIAAIHDAFFRLQAFDRVDIGPYLRALLTDLVQVYGTLFSKAGIETRVEVKPRNLRVHAASAVPLGLIVNELVSNALKHAFPGERGGLVEVRLTRRGDVLLLEVFDDGVGLPTDFAARTAGTLGFTIVTTQIEQLGGELAFGRGRGARFRVAFPQREA